MGCELLVIGFAWSGSCLLKAFVAAGQPAGRAEMLFKRATNWPLGVERFRVHLVEESGRVNGRTWHLTYRRHLEEALEVL